MYETDVLRKGWASQTECSLPVSHLCTELVPHEKCNSSQFEIVMKALPVHHHQCGQINGRIEGRLSLIALSEEVRGK